MTLRKPLKFLVTLFLFFVILGGMFYWTGTRTGLVEQQLNAWLDSFLSSQLPLAVTIKDVGGQPWHNLRLVGVRIDELSGDSTIPFVQIDTIYVAYNWHDLLSGRWRVLTSRIAGIDVLLRDNPDGTLHAPWARPAPQEPAEKRDLTFPELSLESTTVARLHVARKGKDTVYAELRSLQGSLELADNRLTIQTRASGLTYAGNLDVRVDSAAAEVIGVGGEWFINDLFAQLDSSSLSGSAHIHGKTERVIDLSIQAPIVRWNDLSRFVAVDIPGSGQTSAQIQVSGGEVSGRGTISGTLFERQIKGLAVRFSYADNHLKFSELNGSAVGADISGSGFLDLSTTPISFGVDADVQHFDVSNLAAGALSSDLSGTFHVAGEGVTDEDLRVQISTPHAYGQVDQLYIQEAAGDLTVTIDSLYFGDKFRATYNGIQATLSGALAYAGNVSIIGYAHVPVITPVIDSLGFPGSAGAAVGTFVLSDSLLDPTLQFDAQGTSLSYKGAEVPDAHITADLEHAFTNATGTMEITGHRPDLWGFPADSASLAVRILPDRFYFDPLQIYRDADTLQAAAYFTPETRQLVVQRLAAGMMGKEFRVDERADFRVDEDTLWIIRAAIEQDSGAFVANGWVAYDGPFKLHAAVTNLAIGTWTTFVLPDDTLAGTLFAEFEGEGDFASPRIEYRVRLSDAAYNGFPVGDIVSAGTLIDTAVIIDSLLLTTSVSTYSATGVVPLERSGKTWRPAWSRPVEAHVELTGGGLRLISMALTDVERLDGTVRASADVSGFLGTPKYQGRFTLEDGTLKVWQLVKPLTDLNLVIDFRDSVATIERAEAVATDAKHTGRISATGKMVFRSLTTIDYNLMITGANVPIDYEYADFSGRFDFTVTGRGYNPPVLSGDAYVREAYYRDPFESVDSLALVATEVEIDTTSWDINLNVHIPKNAWIKNPDVNAELSGDLRVLRQRGRWNYLGTLRPLRGSYDFLGRRFRNLRGEVVFDDISEPDPRLNLEADVRLPLGRDTSYALGTVSGSQRDVTVQVQGRLSAPEIIPPAWLGNRNFILALNPLGNPTTQSERGLVESATIGATGLLAGELERLGTRTLGVETFELRPSSTGSLDPLQTELAIGTYVLPDIYVYGSSEFDLTKGTEIGFEYRLKNWLTLQGNRDRKNLYHFDLNLKWEMDK